MTASVIYARGGGHGHAMRGAVVQRLLRAQGHTTQLLVTPSSARYLDCDFSCAPLSAVRGHTLFVDTFPRGWQNELDDAALARFSRRVLIARYNCDPKFATEMQRYDRVLSPYPADRDEWPALSAVHTGWLVRTPPLHVEPEGSDFVVLDPGARVPATLLERLAAFARALGLSLVHLTRAPRRVAAKKLLSIGAGYNTVYELAATTADVRFYPLARRWDDQARRAAHVRRSAPTLAAVLEWLRAPACIEPMCRAVAAPTLGAL